MCVPGAGHCRAAGECLALPALSPELPLTNPADTEDPLRVTDETRTLGLVVCRGTSVTLVAPTAGTEEIANPFIQPVEEE